MAKDKLKNTVYNGKQRCWDFKKYGQCPQATVLGVGRLDGTLARGCRSSIKGLLSSRWHQNRQIHCCADLYLVRGVVAIRILCLSHPLSGLHSSDFKSKSNPTVQNSALKTGTRKIGAVEGSHYTKEEYESLKQSRRKILPPSASNVRLRSP